MLKALKVFTFGCIAIAASAVTSNDWSAFAAGPNASAEYHCGGLLIPPEETTPHCVGTYAGYYIPYAVLVAASDVTTSNAPKDMVAARTSNEAIIHQIFEERFKKVEGGDDAKKYIKYIER